MALQLLDEDDTITIKDSELGMDDGDDDTTYTVRVVAPQVIKRLRKAHTKRRPTGGQGMADVLDAEAFGEALFDYVLTGWSGVLHRGVAIGPDDMVQTSAGAVKAKTQLDGSRKAALLERAGANQTGAEGRAESFRTAP
jgi:hypothetical protein